MQTLTTQDFKQHVLAKSLPDDAGFSKWANQYTVESDPNVLSFVFSSKATDLAGDRVFPKGIDTTNYMLRNPLCLLHHDTKTFPIGKTVKLDVVGDQLIGSIQFFTDLDEANVGTTARAAVELIRRGTMGLSITFIPKDFELNATDGIDFSQVELLETSVCTVPCNREAYRITSQHISNSIANAAPQGETGKTRKRLAEQRRRAITLSL